MTEKEKYEPPRKGLSDAVDAGARAAVSMIPLAGAPINEVLKLILESPLDKRRNEWMKQIGEGLQQLEERLNVSLDELQSNDCFIDAAMQASQAALRTHHKEKLIALRNAVLNSALPNSPDEALQQVFLNLVDSFTEWHLKILSFIANPPDRWGVKFKAGWDYPHVHTSNLDNGIEATFPQLKDRKTFYQAIIVDLSSRSLIDMNASDTSHEMATMAGIPSVKITSLADEFLRFIKSPLHDKPEKEDGQL